MTRITNDITPDIISVGITPSLSVLSVMNNKNTTITQMIERQYGYIIMKG